MKSTLPEQTNTMIQPSLHNINWFHDIRVTCGTNAPILQTALAEMLGIFPAADRAQGEVTFTVLSRLQDEPFTLSLPDDRRRTETMRLLTETKLKYYRGKQDGRRYLVYDALPRVNGRALSVIDTVRHEAWTEIEAPIEYQAAFLRRYVFLLALGQLMHPFGFEPCHAAVVTAPWDDQAGALIVGGSGCGKTTLSLGGASTGFGLLGDDIVMLRRETETGPIEAYAISHEVSIRSATLSLWPNLHALACLPVDRRDKRYCSIEQVRPGAARLRAAIRLLLFPSLADGGRSAIIPLRKAQVLQRLIDECMGKSILPQDEQEQLFIFLSALVEQAPGFQLVIARGANDGPQLMASLFAENAL